jgi:uncharacterized protein (TIGR03435 family)
LHAAFKEIAMKKVWIGLWVCLLLAAQQPTFEVASIKPSDYKGGPLRVTAAIRPDGIDFVNVTPRLCIQRAYAVRPYRVVGPEWISTERYNIAAKAAGAISEGIALKMLQTLLADRFHLAFHREQKDTPVYALVVARGGLRIQEDRSQGASQIAPSGEQMIFERVTMGQLVGVVGRDLDRPVLDATGLTGAYSFKLPNSDSGEPSIFELLEERLGLKLESRRAPIDMLVIDHIEKPKAN